MQKKIFNKTIFHLIFIAVISLIAYSNTFEAAFHFDDDHYIIKNSGIRDLNNFIQVLSSADFDLPYKRTFKSRYIGFLTFALNYRIHGLNVAGYHYVNLFVHICTSLLLYFFILLTFNTPSLANSAIKDYAKHIALLTSLLFACHPLQTQAVTYIWQRVTSLCTMFYMLSLVAYIKWRLLQGAKSRLPAPGPAIYYLLSLASAILAIKTKEIAFMLPVMLTLYEMIFFEGKMKKRLLYLIPFIMTMLIIPLTLLNIDKPIGEMISDAGTIRGTTQLPRGEYLLAEFRVLVTYLRLIFLPVNQNLDYDYSRYFSFFNIEVFSSFVFLALIFGLSIYILFRYRDSVPNTRIISFGIIWFFINLMIESSIIPLYNVIFEHRMYLPSIGVFSALTIAIFMLINRWRAYARVITVMLIVIIIVLTGATYARNSVWKDELTLYQDVVNKSPNKASSYSNLGNAYESKGLLDKAIEQYLVAIKIKHNYHLAFYNLGNAYASKGIIDMAITQYLMAVKLKPDFSKAQHNLGAAYHVKGLPDKAIEQYLVAIKIKHNYPRAHYNLGVAYKSQGNFELAIKEYNKALRLRPGWELPLKDLKQLNKKR